MTIAVISHPECALHLTGLGHPEKPQRIEVIEKAIKAYPFSAPVKFYEAPRITNEQLQRVHPESYVKWLSSISPKKDVIFIDEDTVMTPHTLTAAYHAAGAAILAVDLVMSKKIQAAFCNVRPPGHHAESEKAMGFCFFNNVALGVRHAMAAYGLERVAIVDFDVHHGNGTQEIFQYDNGVMLCSSFEHPLYPGYEPDMDNKHILNVPLHAGTNGKTYRDVVEAAWFEKLNAFQPQLIFFSAGFDGHAHDPLANLNLHKDDYVWLTERIAKIAKVHAQGRLISCLEGGYNLEALADSVPAHINAMHL